MQVPITIKPQTHKYLLSSARTALILSIGLLLSSSLIYKDVSLAYGGIIGVWLGVPLSWLYYGVITKFKRFTLIVTESYVQIPSYRGIRLLSPQTLDKTRTLSYMPKRNLENWLSYSFWLINGEKCQISKHLYASSDIKIVLEKLGCL